MNFSILLLILPSMLIDMVILLFLGHEDKLNLSISESQYLISLFIFSISYMLLIHSFPFYALYTTIFSIVTILLIRKTLKHLMVKTDRTLFYCLLFSAYPAAIIALAFVLSYVVYKSIKNQHKTYPFLYRYAIAFAIGIISVIILNLITI